MRIERTYVARAGLAKGLRQRGTGIGQWLRPAAPDAEEVFLQSVDYSGRTILDIGGFHGIHTIFFASRAGADGRVVTFEPDPVNCEAIRRNVSINHFDNVELRNVGVSDQPGELEFAYPADRAWGSAHPDHLALHEDSSEVERSKLPVTSIDAELELGTVANPSFVKIDVEGLELAVLCGMTETVAAHRPAIFLELHGWGRAAKEENSRQVLDWLRSHGYRARHIESDTEVTSADASRAFEGHLYCDAA